MQSASKENGSIKIVGPADRPKVIAVLTTAFTTCLLLRWLYPEPERYLRHFAGFLEYYAGDPYFDGSGAYLEDGQKGALLWLTDKAHRNDKRMMEYLLGSVQRTDERKPKGYSRSSASITPRSHTGISPCWASIPCIKDRAGAAVFSNTALQSWTRRKAWHSTRPPVSGRHVYMSGWDGRSG
ncbi:hypothetical protein V5279_07860 [Bradyrhizobium sp. 26S5]|uniref:hypothetical protein n=1 Tax=Bradyrhizobium sp. 26S5 TaxID=3139729 RepID=UPI0030D4A19E